VSAMSKRQGSSLSNVLKKKRVKSVYCRRSLMWCSMPSTMNSFDLSGLLDICGTFQASGAECERGFSLINAIKTKSRNRLEADHLDMLMRIKASKFGRCSGL